MRPSHQIVRGGVIVAFLLAVLYAAAHTRVNVFEGLSRDENLHVGAGKGDVKEMRRLITQGANVDFKFDGSEPVLIAAIQSRNLEAVQLLLDKGADPNVQTDSTQESALKVARYLPDIRKLLISAGAKEQWVPKTK